MGFLYSFKIVFISHDESLDLRSGRGKRGNTLASVPRCICDCSIVSESILYVLVSECAWCLSNKSIDEWRCPSEFQRIVDRIP